MILDKADASSTEIDDAASALKTAIDSLVEIGDVVKTELERVIDKAKALDTVLIPMGYKKDEMIALSIPFAVNSK